MKTAIFLMVFFLCTGISVSQNNVSAELRCEKSSFLYRESIFIEFALKNNSASDVTIGRPSLGLGTVTLRIADNSGKVLPYWGPIEEVIGTPQITIVAGDEFAEIYDLSFLYGNERGLSFPTYSFKPGTYTLQAEYAGAHEKVKTSAITVSVVEPQGEEKMAMQMYVQACRSMFDKDKSVKGKSVDLFDDLVEKYPNSRYAPAALARAASYCKIVLHDRTRANRYYYRLMEKYVNFGHVLDAFSSMKSEIQARPDKESFLQRIQQNADSSSHISYIRKIYQMLKTVQSK